MPNDQLSRTVDSFSQTVSTVQALVSFEGKNDRLKATYTNFTVLEDGTQISRDSFTTERVISATPELTALVLQLYTLMEQYRGEDEQQRADDLAKHEAEAARWAALSDADKQAEIDAARQAAIDAIAKEPLADPTPTGVAMVASPAVPATPIP